MQDVRLWLEDHVWAVATAGIAAVVFGVTFLAVSTASDRGSPPPDTPAVVELAVVPAPDPDEEPPDAPATDTPAADPNEETVSATEEDREADGRAEAETEEPSSQAEEEPEVADPIDPETDEPSPEAEQDAEQDLESDPEAVAEGDAETERDDDSRGPRGPRPEGPPYAGPYRPPEIDGGEPGEAAGEGGTDAAEVEPAEAEAPDEPDEPRRPDLPRDDPRQPEPRPDEPQRPEPPPEEPEEPPAVLPEFDEEKLIYGGTGWEGAILAGPGIVWSSGLSDRTPWELLLPSAQIRASLVGVGLTYTRALGAPDNPYVIGWWKNGPAPGEVGNVLLAGHRDFTDNDGNIGIGVCWLLPKTQPGDFLIIRDNEAREHHVYTVTEAVAVVWNDPNGVEYLRRTETAIATLVTCEGSFDDDANNYSHRRIIVAELTDTIPFVEDDGTGRSRAG